MNEPVGELGLPIRRHSIAVGDGRPQEICGAVIQAGAHKIGTSVKQSLAAGFSAQRQI